MAKTTSGPLLALCLCIGMTAVSPVSVAGDDGEEKKDKKESSSKTGKPRVFTNADLEKYSKPSKGRKVVRTPPVAALPPQEEVAPVPPRSSLPVEDLLDAASLPDLEERQQELQELLAYLQAKVAWIKNPFLPQPIPPAGETLLDPSLGGGQELELTRSRAFAVETRLGKVRALIQAGGGGAPAPQP